MPLHCSCPFRLQIPGCGGDINSDGRYIDWRVDESNVLLRLTSHPISKGKIILNSMIKDQWGEKVELDLPKQCCPRPQEGEKEEKGNIGTRQSIKSLPDNYEQSYEVTVTVNGTGFSLEVEPADRTNSVPTKVFPHRWSFLDFGNHTILSPAGSGWIVKGKNGGDLLDLDNPPSFMKEGGDDGTATTLGDSGDEGDGDGNGVAVACPPPPVEVLKEFRLEASVDGSDGLDDFRLNEKDIWNDQNDFPATMMRGKDWNDQNKEDKECVGYLVGMLDAFGHEIGRYTYGTGGAAGKITNKSVSVIWGPADPSEAYLAKLRAYVKGAYVARLGIEDEKDDDDFKRDNVPGKRDWSDLLPSETKAARSLGYDETSWDDKDGKSDCFGTEWDKLSQPDRKALVSLGYDECLWTDECNDDTPNESKDDDDKLKVCTYSMGGDHLGHHEVKVVGAAKVRGVASFAGAGAEEAMVEDKMEEAKAAADLADKELADAKARMLAAPEGSEEHRLLLLEYERKLTASEAAHATLDATLDDIVTPQYTLLQSLEESIAALGGSNSNGNGNGSNGNGQGNANGNSKDRDEEIDRLNCLVDSLKEEAKEVVAALGSHHDGALADAKGDLVASLAAEHADNLRVALEEAEAQVNNLLHI